MGILYHGQTLEYWKNNAEEDYQKVPISVLKYISVLEEVNKKSILLVKQVVIDCERDQLDHHKNGEYENLNKYISENLSVQ